jgi:multisubunit Na+/H+ antiporter MnhB subunit
MKRIFNITVFLFLAAMFVYFRIYTDPGQFVKAETSDYIALARSMNIKNMVTAVYLGPRLFDTFVEALVVVATAFSMRYLWGKK